MARPKQRDELRRRHKVTIRFDDAEYERANSDAEKLGATLSSYIRAKISRGFVRIPQYAKIDTASINQLSKLGGLMKKIHTESDGFYREQTAAILGEIRNILVAIHREQEAK